MEYATLNISYNYSLKYIIPFTLKNIVVMIDS